MPTGSKRNRSPKYQVRSALPNDVTLVKRAIEQEMATSAGAGDLAANCSRFARLFVELIDARRGDAFGHLFFCRQPS